jgi:hypothetical protein
MKTHQCESVKISLGHFDETTTHTLVVMGKSVQKKVGDLNGKTVKSEDNTNLAVIEFGTGLGTSNTPGISKMRSLTLLRVELLLRNTLGSGVSPVVSSAGTAMSPVLTECSCDVRLEDEERV